MTKRQYIIYAIGVLALLLASCARDVPEIKEEKSEIAVTTNLTPMRKRANTIDGISDLQACDLRIDAYYNGTTTPYLSNEKLHYNNDASAWMFWNSSTSTQLHYYWPIEGSVYDPTGVNITVSSLDFVGCCPYTAPSYITSGPSYSVGAISFEATMPTTIVAEATYMADQSSMDEYLVAIAADKTYADQGVSGVPLEFKHPLAIIKFSITAASGTHVQINSISISDLKTSGTCTYNGSIMTWGSYSGSATMTIAQTLKIGGTTETSQFLVIPNNYGSKYLTVNATWDDWSDVTISDYGTNVDFSWEPGRIYTYNLTLDKYGLKVDVTKFTEQW